MKRIVLEFNLAEAGIKTQGIVLLMENPWNLETLKLKDNLAKVDLKFMLSHPSLYSI